MDPELLEDLNLINKEIKKEYKSLRNRTQSIILDSKWIEQVYQAYDKPLVPNERCGLWYVNPLSRSESCYFKSTDGHINIWDFSTRRLNFHLLDLISKNSGVIIVDSTRRGKKIPDSLSKTIPIWCAVLNCIMLPASQTEYEENNYWLFTPPKTVVKSERLRIIEKMPLLLEKVKGLKLLDKEKLESLFHGKILRPIWVYPGMSLPEKEDNINEQVNESFIPIYLTTASFMCQDGVDKRNGFTYVQGAADDHELWSNGLTPDLFWDNIEYFADLDHSEENLISFVDSLLSQKESKNDNNNFWYKDLTQITDEIYVGEVNSKVNLKQKDEHISKYGKVLVVSETFQYDLEKNPEIFCLSLTSGSKKSSKDLRSKLGEVIKMLQEQIMSKKAVLILCGNGSDLSIGVTLALISSSYDLSWNLLTDPIERKMQPINKTTIRQHLIKIIDKKKRVNPSRSTLNSINSYLML